MKLTNHQREFLQYILDNHFGYGFTTILKGILMRGKYDDNRERNDLKVIVKIHNSFLKGESYKSRNHGNFDIKIYHKPKKYLR